MDSRFQTLALEFESRALMELENKIKGRRISDDGDNSYYPLLLEDLLFEEILPRLPVESLIRFKCVSKKWLHHISEDSRFKYKHLRRQSQTTEFSIITPWSSDKIYVFDGRSKWAHVKDVSLYTKRFCCNSGIYTVVGSCNGLVCVCVELGNSAPHALVIHQDQQVAIMLWNPETGEARDTVVPPLPPSFYRRPDNPNLMRKSQDHPVFGFGYDECRDDYKVVRVMPTQPTLLNFDVFSRNSGEWRRLEKGLFGYTVCCGSSEPALVNGCLYWLVLKVEERRRCILSLDLRDDEFRIIDVLERSVYFESFPFRSHRLVKWNRNCLAYLSSLRRGKPVDFRFRLILDGNGDVVTEGLNMSSSRFVHQMRIKRGWLFCGVSQDRFFVAERVAGSISCASKLMLCDSFNCADESVGRRELLMSSWAALNGFAVRDYVPSLVSVYPDRKTMMEEKKKMETKYWVDKFWQKVGLSKQQFGLGMIEEPL